MCLEKELLDISDSKQSLLDSVAATNMNVSNYMGQRETFLG
jgi:hypothetical protein